MDLAVPSGAPIQAPAAGRVVFAAVVVDRPVLTLEHADGTYSSLEPVEADVAVGAVVDAGDPVGRLAGAPPHCTRACVHWGVREPDAWRVGDATFDRYLDPLVLIGWSGPSVLWPHAAPHPARP
ncbi:M23 family metallopeptidase [Micrococcus luteus]|uniref:M23 family metallopeptidase n=1 Tax=Micrococcus luteus TaxID=1270 RepID=UPI0015E07958|nr:M23 family metallopeptidase [Micrococcus luteus]